MKIVDLKKSILLWGLLLVPVFGYAVDKQVQDDTNMSLGARSLGLGRTYVSRINDGHALFLNPASLGSLKNNSLSFSGSQLMDGELYWFYGGGSILINPRTSLGLGVIYSNESGGSFRDNNNSGLGQKISLSDINLLLSLGHRLSMPLFDCKPENLFLGARLKYISKTYQALNYNSSGFEWDAGAIWEANTHVRVGAEIKDLLGTQLITNGFAENFDTRMQLGVEWDILEKGSLWENKDQRLTLSLDTVHSENTNWMWRGGAEWQFNPYLDFRAGFYQEQEYSATNPAGDINNYFTFGLGYKMGIFNLNYAFQPQESIRGINHYLGVVVYEPEFAKRKLDLVEPKDNSVTFFKQVKLKGKLEPEACLRINGQMFRVSENSSFEALMPLSPGRNPFSIEGCDDDANAVPGLKKELVVYRALYHMEANFISPQDKTVTHDAQTQITGFLKPRFELVAPELSQEEIQKRSEKAFAEYQTVRKIDFSKGDLKIDGQKIAIDSEGKFVADRNLYIAKNKISTRYVLESENQDNVREYRILRLKKFEDIKESDSNRKSFEELGTLLLINTADQKRFEPENTPKRKEMSAYMISAYYPELQDNRQTPPEYVKPVQDDELFKGYLRRNQSEKMVVGYPDGKYRPNQIITRAEGISVFSRFNERLEPLPTQNISTSFKDIGPRHWAHGTIAKNQTQGILQGYSSQELVPNRALTKFELALLLLRTQYIKHKIDDLYDWDTY